MAKPLSSRSTDSTRPNGEALDKPGVLKFDRDYEAHLATT